MSENERERKEKQQGRKNERPWSTLYLFSVSLVQLITEQEKRVRERESARGGGGKEGTKSSRISNEVRGGDDSVTFSR